MDPFLEEMEKEMRKLVLMDETLRADGDVDMTNVEPAQPYAKMFQACKPLLANPLMTTVDQITGNGLNPKELSMDNLIKSFGASRPDGGTTSKTVHRDGPKRVESIFNNFERLQLIVGKHAKVLQTRWWKRTAMKRRKLLLEAWPNMPPEHRPDFNALRRGWKGDQHRDSYLLPHINLEDLSKPKNLILLFESRTQHAPDVFAWRDSSTVQIANSIEAVVVLRAVGNSMLLTGQKSRKTYGKVVSWSDNNQAAQDMYLGIGSHLGEGLILLEIQEKLMNFPCSLCRAVVARYGPQPSCT